MMKINYGDKIEYADKITNDGSICQAMHVYIREHDHKIATEQLCEVMEWVVANFGLGLRHIDDGSDEKPKHPYDYVIDSKEITTRVVSYDYTDKLVNVRANWSDDFYFHIEFVFYNDTGAVALFKLRWDT